MHGISHQTYQGVRHGPFTALAERKRSAGETQRWNRAMFSACLQKLARRFRRWCSRVAALAVPEQIDKLTWF